MEGRHGLTGSCRFCEVLCGAAAERGMSRLMRRLHFARSGVVAFQQFRSPLDVWLLKMTAPADSKIDRRRRAFSPRRDTPLTFWPMDGAGGLKHRRLPRPFAGRPGRERFPPRHAGEIRYFLRAFDLPVAMTRSLRAMPLSAAFRAMLRNAATIVREHSSFGSDSSAQQSAV